MTKNYNRSIKLLCVTCGSGDTFVTDEQIGVITCKKCNRIYHGGKDELIELNQSLINKEVEAMKKVVKNDMIKELNDMFRKTGLKIK